MTDLQDYLEVPNHMFQLVRTGDYVRWKFGTIITSGATVMQIGLTNSGRQNWTVNGYKGEFTIYWDLHKSVWIRTNVSHVILQKKINIISATLLELVKDLNMTEKFKKSNAKIKKGMENVEKKLVDRENKKRKKKNKNIKIYRSKSLI